MKKITNILFTINSIVTTFIAYYTFFKIDGGINTFKTMNWTALIFAIIAGGVCLWFHFTIVWIVKAETKGLIEKIEKRYKAYTDSFSSWFLYTAAISAIVNEKIIKQMTEEEQAKILYDGKFLIDYLERFGFSEKVKDEMKKMYHEDELKKLKNEPNRNIK